MTMCVDKTSGFSAKVVLDSIAPCGRRLISVEAKYWRMIHSEIMTHRDRARNAASSRAIPWRRNNKAGNLVPNCMYNMILTEPFYPVFIGGEQKGMQSGAEMTEPARTEVLACIERMRTFCLQECDRMASLGCHKSIVNRYVEPWMFITTLMTATEWNNFFRLRIHPKAEKHFNLLAQLIRRAIHESEPQELAECEWHMPYLRDEDHRELEMPDSPYYRRPETLRHVSAARCARLSYLTHDGYRSMAEDLRLFETLIHPHNDDGTLDDAIHASALEHVAEANGRAIRSGPFVGWSQLRKEFPNENIEG